MYQGSILGNFLFSIFGTFHFGYPDSQATFEKGNLPHQVGLQSPIFFHLLKPVLVVQDIITAGNMFVFFQCLNQMEVFSRVVSGSGHLFLTRTHLLPSCLPQLPAAHPPPQNGSYL